MFLIKDVQLHQFLLFGHCPFHFPLLSYLRDVWKMWCLFTEARYKILGKMWLSCLLGLCIWNEHLNGSSNLGNGCSGTFKHHLFLGKLSSFGPFDVNNYWQILWQAYVNSVSHGKFKQVPWAEPWCRIGKYERTILNGTIISSIGFRLSFIFWQHLVLLLFTLVSADKYKSLLFIMQFNTLN